MQMRRYAGYSTRPKTFLTTASLDPTHLPWDAPQKKSLLHEHVIAAQPNRADAFNKLRIIAG
jgi:hypothetical protein